MTVYDLSADPGKATGCFTNRFVINSLIRWLSNPLVPTALWRRHTQTVRDRSSSYKIDFFIVIKNFLSFFTLARTLNTFLSKWFFFKFTLIKSTQWNNLRLFPKACTHIFNNINFRLQCLQIGVFQQRYFKCKCETPYFEGELLPKTCTNLKNVLQKNFLSGLVTTLENLFVFGKSLWKISSNWWFQKKFLINLTLAQTLKVCSTFLHS